MGINHPIRSMPELPVVRTMQDAVEMFRVLKAHWALTNDFCDDVGGLTDGHTDKCLGPSEAKRLGYDTFALFMELFAIELHPQINMDAVKRMEAVWEGRKRPIEYSETRRVSRKLLDKAKPHVAKEMGRAGAAKKMTMLSAEHRSRIARKAANTRWKNERARRRATRSALAATASPVEPSEHDRRPSPVKRTTCELSAC